MSDSLPELADVAKVGGGLGVGGVVTLLLGRVLRNEDKVLDRLEGLHRELGEVRTQLAVLLNANDSRDSAIKTLQAQSMAQARTISRLEIAVAKLGVKVSDGDGA